MKASDGLKRQVRKQVEQLAKQYQAANAGSVPNLTFYKRFHAEVENGEGVIGYQYLHGTHKNVGDFSITGTANTLWKGGQSRMGAAVTLPGSDQQQDPNACRPAPGPTAVDVPGRFTVEMNAFFQWNDMIDPNGEYLTDKIKDAFAYVITLGERSAYRISITWNEPVRVVLDDNGRILETSGYPFE